MKNSVILVSFNAKLADGCDYATQTLRILGRTNDVYALLLGEPITWNDILLHHEAPLIQRAYNSTVIRPFCVIPGQRWKPIKQANYFLYALFFRCFLALRYYNRKKILWFFESWNMVPVYMAFFGYQTIYDCVDYYYQAGYESIAPVRYLLQRASLVTCISPALAQAYKKYRPDIHLVPSGVALSKVPPTRQLYDKRGKNECTVGYIGGINYRLDYPLLFRVIHALPQVHFVFVGPIQKHLIPDEREVEISIERLLALPNVTYIHEVSKQEISRYINTFHVGMVPYSMAYPFNRYSFPMKVLEYFWHGIPVVSTPLPSFRSLGVGMYREKTSEGWIRAIRFLQKNTPPARDVQKQRAIAREHSWEQKITAITLLLGERV